MSESTDTAARERLEALVGEWTPRAGPAAGPPWPGGGRRDGPPFAQRYTGRFSEDGRTIAGRWEICEDGATWRTDFELTYTKV